MEVSMNSKGSAKRSTLTRTEARKALRNAKKRQSKQSAKPKAWREGGHEWSKVLGRFGVATPRRK